jgi:hypothetical protein
MYFPRNWEFGSTLSKLWNFERGFEPPEPPPPRYATGANDTHSLIVTQRAHWPICFCINVFTNLHEFFFRWLHIRTCSYQRMVSEWQILKSNDQRTTYRHTAHLKHQLEDKNLSVPLWRKCSMIITPEHNMYSLYPYMHL